MIDTAKVEPKEIAFRILCDCEEEFRAEDFMPECPYCGRVYRIELVGDLEKVKTKVSFIGMAPLEGCTSG